MQTKNTSLPVLCQHYCKSYTHFDSKAFVTFTLAISSYISSLLVLFYLSTSFSNLLSTLWTGYVVFHFLKLPCAHLKILLLEIGTHQLNQIFCSCYTAVRKNMVYQMKRVLSIPFYMTDPYFIMRIFTVHSTTGLNSAELLCQNYQQIHLFG